jgi:hypothetical protein
MRTPIPYDIEYKLYLRSKGICEQCHQARATTIHHISGVSFEGSNLLSNLLHVCNACHSKIHPWLNVNGLRRVCTPIRADVLCTIYASMRKEKRNVTLLETYSSLDIRNAITEIKERAQEQNARG